MPRWVLVKKVILGFQGSDLAVGGRGGGGCFFSCIRVKMQHFVFFGDFQGGWWGGRFRGILRRRGPPPSISGMLTSLKCVILIKIY